MQLSKKSQEFIDNLNVYLFSSGRKEKEIIEILEELTAHLLEAEQKGKRIDHITGNSPKEYMRSIAKEMENDYLDWIKFIPLLLLSVLAYSTIGDVIIGELSYTSIVLIGMPIICIIMLIVYKVYFQYMSIRTLLDSKISIIVLLTINILSTAAFLLLLFFGNKGTAILVIDSTLGKLIVASIALIYLIGFALWSKTWLPFIPLAVYLPTLLVDFFPVKEEMKTILSSVFIIIGGSAFLLSMKKEKQINES